MINTYGNLGPNAVGMNPGSLSTNNRENTKTQKCVQFVFDKVSQASWKTFAIGTACVVGSLALAGLIIRNTREEVLDQEEIMKKLKIVSSESNSDVFENFLEFGPNAETNIEKTITKKEMEFIIKMNGGDFSELPIKERKLCFMLLSFHGLFSDEIKLDLDSETLVKIEDLLVKNNSNIREILSKANKNVKGQVFSHLTSENANAPIINLNSLRKWDREYTGNVFEVIAFNNKIPSCITDDFEIVEDPKAMYEIMEIIENNIINEQGFIKENLTEGQIEGIVAFLCKYAISLHDDDFQSTIPPTFSKNFLNKDLLTFIAKEQANSKFTEDLELDDDEDGWDLDGLGNQKLAELCCRFLPLNARKQAMKNIANGVDVGKSLETLQPWTDLNAEQEDDIDSTVLLALSDAERRLIKSNLLFAREFVEHLTKKISGTELFNRLHNNVSEKTIVLNRLQPSGKGKHIDRIVGFLKRWIEEASNEELRDFLDWATESRNVMGSRILVEVVKGDYTHEGTCSNLVEFPSALANLSYEAFVSGHLKPMMSNLTRTGHKVKSNE